MTPRPRIASLPVSLLLLCCAVTLALPRASAAPASPESGSTLDPKGRPKKADKPEGVWYAVWFDEGQWHLRCNGPDNGQPIKFTGTVTVTVGAIIRGDTEGLEPDNKKPKKRDPNADYIDMHAGNKGFDFSFGNRGRTDGLDFKVSERTETITFKLSTAGNDNTERVFVGKEGKHPEKIPFTLPAHPEKPVADKK